MQIKKLKIENFGPVKQLDLDIAGNLVGIVGRNGQGKSHVLTALRFLFANDICDTNASYIRHGETSAVVEAAFTTNGLEGVISKRIRKSNVKHSLLWEGKEYTKPEPIQLVLEDIFGSPRTAITNVCFRRQGDLTQLLFGTDATRENMFASLLDADFSKPRDILATKANVLRSKFTDLSSILVDEQARLEEATAMRNASEAELKTIPVETIKAYQDLKKTHAVMVRIRDTTASLEDLARQRVEVETLLTTLAYASEYESLDRISRQVAQDADRVQERINLMRSAVDAKAKAAALDASLAANRTKLSGMRKELEGFPVINLSELQAKVTIIQERLSKHQDWKRDTASLAAVRADMVGVPQWVEETKRQIEQDRNNLSGLRLQHHGLSSLLAVRREIRQCSKLSPDKATCGKCGLNLDASSIGMLSDEEIEKIGQQLKILDNQILTLESDIPQKEKELISRSAALNGNRSRELELSLRIETLVHFQNVDEAADKDELEKVRTAYDQNRVLLEKRAHLDEGIRFVCADITRDERDLSSLTHLIQDPSTAEDMERLAAQRVSLLESAKGYTSRRDSLRQPWQELSTAQARLAVLQENGKRLKSQLAQFIEEAGPVEFSTGNLETLEREMEQRAEQVQRFHTLSELLSERTRVVEQVEGRIRGLRIRMQDDEHLRMMTGRIDAARNLLSRSGIPGIYMRERFLQLADLTQHYLWKMNASFNAFPDADGLRFRVIDPEKDAEAEIDMNKLSGGQRVRLSIAFMLAAGQLLVPNLRFLTLDEPSTHLDDEGVDSLVNLFANLAQQLQDDDQQVWVVDHREEFMRAFSDVHQL